MSEPLRHGRAWYDSSVRVRESGDVVPRLPGVNALLTITLTAGELVARDATGDELARVTIVADEHSDRHLAARSAAVTLVRQAFLRLDPKTLDM